MAKAYAQGIKGVKRTAHVVYDFSKDGGTFGGGNEIDLITLAANTIVHDVWFEVETAVTSAGAATVEVGVTGGDTDGIVKQLGKAVLVADYVSVQDDKGAVLFDDTNDHDIRYKVTSETTLSLLVGTATLTAGKIHFYFDYSAGY